MYCVFIIQCDIFEKKEFLKGFQNYENVKNVQLSKGIIPLSQEINP